jgi:hypothetical protein
MHRRALLRWLGAVAAVVPLERVRIWAQPRDLSPEAIAMLHELAPTVLPSSLGEARLHASVDGFVNWTKGYQEGVALSHGYGHPRLQKTGPSPVPSYNLQLASLAGEARTRGQRFGALPLETRRTILDLAITKAGVRGLPARPQGQHVAVDLMAFYFRSSEANDACYHALIQREVCRPIQITTRRPDAIG